MKKRGRPKREKKEGDVREALKVAGSLPQSVAAWLVGLSAKTLREKIDAPRKSDGTYDGRELVAWCIKRAGISRGGGPSKALERMRRAKALAAERRNLVEEGRVIPVEDMRIAAQGISQVMRIEMEAIERVHGPAVGQALREMVDRAAKAWEDRLQAIVPGRKL